MGFGFGGHNGSGDYSYATLTASMDNPHIENRTYRSRTISQSARNNSVSISGRPRVDRRYSPPPTKSRHRAETVAPSSVFASLSSGLTLPRSVITKSSRTTKDVRTETTKKPDSTSRRSTHAKLKPAPVPEKKTKVKKADIKKNESTDKKSNRRYSTSSGQSKANTARSKAASIKSKKAASVSSKKPPSQKCKSKSKGGFSM